MYLKIVLQMKKSVLMSVLNAESKGAIEALPPKGTIHSSVMNETYRKLIDIYEITYRIMSQSCKSNLFKVLKSHSKEVKTPRSKNGKILLMI